MKVCKAFFGLAGVSLVLACTSSPREAGNSKDYHVAAYYFPNYHVDKRNEKYHEAGWTEWKLVKEANPKFEGHQQPKVPLWGYTDEADPIAMAQKIQAAADHGIDAFIFDWYYYDDGLFLERALEEGFMKAANNDQLNFSLMWANHDWEDIHPYTSNTERKLLYPGKITPETWEAMTDYVIDKYFLHHAYWLIDGAPYFSVYDLTRFIENFGSVESATVAIEQFRDKVKRAGFPDLHLNAVVWGRTILPSEEVVSDPAKLVNDLGFDSFTSYVWIHHVAPKSFPTVSYDSVKSAYFDYATHAVSQFDIPYFPNVSMGWDASPRTNQQTQFEDLGYPYMSILAGNTPDRFKKALDESKTFMDKNSVSHKILTINCWNEWTEGSYLEPDSIHGMAYLEAIRDVFGIRR